MFAHIRSKPLTFPQLQHAPSRAAEAEDACCDVFEDDGKTYYFPKRIPTEPPEECRAKVPKVTQAVRDFARSLGGVGEPFHVEVRPFHFSERTRCYGNCDIACQWFRWQMVLGYSLWTMDDLFLSAEHHCICRRSDGSYIDVTPEVSGQNRVLFVPIAVEPTHENIEGFVKSSQAGAYLVLINDPLVHEAVSLLDATCERYFVAKTQALQSGLPVSTSEQRYYEAGMAEVDRLLDNYLSRRAQRQVRRVQEIERKRKKAERRRRKKCRQRARCR